jgi:hypothetical protein
VLGRRCPVVIVVTDSEDGHTRHTQDLLTRLMAAEQGSGVPSDNQMVRVSCRSPLSSLASNKLLAARRWCTSLEWAPV